MSEQLKEALSAVVDGEASEFELRRVLDEIERDDVLLRGWHNYHLMRNAVQGENTTDVQGLGDRIWAALDADEVFEKGDPEVPSTPSADDKPIVGGRRRGLAAGGAIAAGLALTVALTTNFGGVPADSNPTAAPAQLADVAPSVAAQADPVSSEPASEENLASTALAAVGAAPLEDYGPGFVRDEDLSRTELLRNETYYLLHVQQNAMNEENLLRFVKMISYPQ